MSATFPKSLLLLSFWPFFWTFFLFFLFRFWQHLTDLLEVLGRVNEDAPRSEVREDRAFRPFQLRDLRLNLFLGHFLVCIRDSGNVSQLPNRLLADFDLQLIQLLVRPLL